METFFKALADGTRLRILGLLLTGEVCVCHIHESLRIAQPKASLGLIRSGGRIDYVVCVGLRSSAFENMDGCGRGGKPRSGRFSMASIPSSRARRSNAAGLICPSVECRRRWL
ncbi:MAG: ArsR family transcriptional regulator [Acidobacteriota bacterium]